MKGVAECIKHASLRELQWKRKKIALQTKTDVEEINKEMYRYARVLIKVYTEMMNSYDLWIVLYSPVNDFFFRCFLASRWKNACKTKLISSLSKKM